jgi:hypothetical protein
MPQYIHKSHYFPWLSFGISFALRTVAKAENSNGQDSLTGGIKNAVSNWG